MFRYTALFALAVLNTGLNAQTKFQLWTDIAAFRYDEKTSFVECYYAFPREGVTVAQAGGKFEGSVIMTAVINNEGHEADPFSRVWRVPVAYSDAETADRLLIGKINLTLAPGKYRMSLSAKDETRMEVGDTVSTAFEVRGYPARSPMFSDIELCATVRQIEYDSTNIFYKNTLEVVPNPPAIYGQTLPVLYYYAELYNGDLDFYVIRSEVVSSWGSTVLSKSQRKSGKHESRVEAGALKMSELPSGVYTMILSYGDTLGSMRVSQSKRFYVFNPDVPIDSVQAMRTASSIAYEFTALAEDELDNQFAAAIYIATGDERAMWKELRGAESKRKFLTTFWNSRDTDPSTPENEQYIEYTKRIGIANDQFRTAYRPGWKTDRGRVFVMYGPPDYVERNQVESDAKPYERWTYDNLQGGVEFIFIDKGGFNELELVHSTLRSELNNPNWQQFIKTR